jgi:hypothetical protein
MIEMISSGCDALAIEEGMPTSFSFWSSHSEMPSSRMRLSVAFHYRQCTFGKQKKQTNQSKAAKRLTGRDNDA